MAKPFPTEQIKEAAAIYYQYRSYAETARRCAEAWGRPVSRQQIQYWDDNSEVFQDGQKQEATRTDKKLSAKMLALETKALELCIEMMAEKPDSVKFKEAAWAAAVMHDKRQVLEGKATSISGPSQSFLDRLTDIESKLTERNAERAAEKKLGGVVARFPQK